MATLGMDYPSHPQLAGSTAQTTHNLNYSVNVPLNRGLERALEEGANSGGLNLSGRKLKEFPRFAGNYDLSDTVEADLSKNRLTEVPIDICEFVSLETLNLYHNCIKVIPDAIVNLQTLTYLNISRNQLSSLPASLCDLPLKVLIVSNNKLGSLPEEIGQLKTLMELDVSCNEITALPHQIGQLKSLRELNIRRNYLEGLPEELTELPLVKFDVSCNKLFAIPISFRRMTQLHSLVLDHNPLQSPPAQICTKGKVHIFKYLSTEASRIHKTTDSLYLHTMENPSLQRHTDGSTEDIYPTKKDSDSGVGSDSGDKRLSAIEPSDEEAVSINMPMKNILEEEQYHIEEANKLVSPVSGGSTPVLAVVTNNSSEERCRTFVEEQEGLTSKFTNYIKGRITEFDEPLRIEEDTSWMTDVRNSLQRTGVNANEVILDHLRETADVLQDSNRNTINTESSRDVKLYSANEMNAATLDLENTALNGKTHKETSAHQVQNSLNNIEDQNVEGRSSSDESEEKSPDESPSSTSTTPFGLKPRCGFLRTQRSAESVDPQFTIRRKMEQLREELEMIDQLRENIETRLKTELPRDVQGLGTALMDGVVLCHLVNYIRPRSVGSIHVPSPAVPKLSMAKCRRNVENFLDACRKMGVPEDKLCLPHHILEEKGLVKVSVTVQALVDVATVKRTLFT